MKVLVFGKTGQVATELAQFDGVTCIGRDQADLTDPGACAAVIASTDADAVINAAAYTDVDKAEEDEALATVINGDTPTAMARACAEIGVPLIHISTDYVFEGTGEAPWKTTDATIPRNAYGRSKLAGEKGIRASGATHAILRTSWVVSAHGANFLKTMLRLSETRDMLDVVADQIGGPTPARNIAAACLDIAAQLQKNPRKSGAYNYSGAPDVFWADFACDIFEQAGRSVTVTPILTRDYPTPATRPLNSRLDCCAIQQVFGISRPNWRLGVKQILQDIEETL